MKNSLSQRRVGGLTFESVYYMYYIIDSAELEVTISDSSKNLSVSLSSSSSV
jgi:hypothetical protein